jgi:hypothetical protein
MKYRTVIHIYMLGAFLTLPLTFLVNFRTDDAPVEDQLVPWFSFFVVVWAAVVLKNEIHSTRRRQTVMPALGIMILVCVWVATASRYKLSFDCRAYLEASSAILSNSNPYVHKKGSYLYPPLLAELFALARRALQTIRTLFWEEDSPKSIYYSAFNLWRGFQIFLAIGVYILGYQFARLLRADRLHASFAPLVLLIAGHAFWRTLISGQANLFVTFCLIGAIVWLYHHRVLSGMAIALGAHIKLYPLVVLGAVVSRKRWQAIIWTAVCILFIAGVEVLIFGTDNFEYYLTDRALQPQLRFAEDNYSVISIIDTIFNRYKVLGNDGRLTKSTIRTLTKFVQAGLLMWLLARFLHREFIWSRLKKRLKQRWLDQREYAFRTCGHVNDFILYIFFFVPTIWNHHYLITFPVLIWQSVVLGRVFWTAWIPIAMIIVPRLPSSFGLLPALGIVLLFMQSSPSRVRRALDAPQKQFRI